MSTENPTPPARKQISIEFPKEMAGVYSNVAFITHTQTEVILDFALVLPHAPKGRVLSRVIMSPARAKMLQLALAQNLANFERQFGEIKLAQNPNLADELFRFRPDEKDKEPEE